MSLDPPTNPVISPDIFLTQLSSNIGQTPNPWFTVAHQFLPRNLHDVIKWSRYITVHSPTVTEVIRKLCTYPITEFLVDTEDEDIKKKYREIFESFKLKQTLHDVGFDYYTLGNVFISIYFPIHRILKCPNALCNTEYSAKTAEFLKFKQYQFVGECPRCSYTGAFIRKDTKSMNIADMNIIKWNPENIAVAHNPITGEHEYYYKIPNDIKKKVMLGDRLFVNSVPWAFVEAIKNNQDFKFDNGSIFHLRNLSTGAVVEGCSVPPLISLYSLVFYQATLRKANESIATEHMNPMRVVFPQPGSANADPVVSMSLKNFVENMQQAIKRHKQDRNYFLVAPAPIGYQAIGGEGKNLLVSQEIDQAEQTILLSLGVSKELLSGQTNWTSSTVGLRLLENTLFGYTAQITKLIEWVMRKVTTYLSVTYCEVTLTPFKLTDDDITKQLLLQMAQGGQASYSTLFEALGLDYDEELDKMKDDAVSRAIVEVESRFEVDEATFMAAKKTGDKLDDNSDYQAVLVQAQGITSELNGKQPEEIQEVLNNLRVTSYPTFVMVEKLLQEQIENQMALQSPQEGQGEQPGQAQPGFGEKQQPKKPADGSKPSQPKK